MSKNSDAKVQGKPKPNSKNKILIIAVSVCLSLAVLFGAALGVISLVRNANAALSYDGITMDKELASFFIGRFKTRYINDLSKSYPGAEDSEEFWNTAYDKTRTHGEVMRELCTEQLKQIIVNNYLFDRYSELSDEDENLIEKAITETVEYHAGGSMDEFEKQAEKYGFDYSSYCQAVEMLYKSDRAKSAIYGNDGSAIASDSAECERYLSEYSRVSLIFIRTEDKLVYGDDNSSLVVPLTEEERASRLSVINSIKTAIEAKSNGGEGQINPQAFASYLLEYGEGDDAYDTSGYYFHKDSEFTADYSVQFSAITDKALSMKVGEYAEVEVDVRNMDDPNASPSPAVCFIYKSAPKSGVYAESSLERCFSDFYSNAASALYLNASNSLRKEVNIGNKFSDLDFYAISTNSILYPRYDG